MATTLTNIVSTLRTADILEPGQIFYGFTDGLQPPYASVMGFEAVITYDTGGPAYRESKFTVLCVAKSFDDAEALATQVDTLLNVNYNVSPDTMTCLQESYKVSQMDENLYQFGAELNYTLWEDLHS